MKFEVTELPLPIVHSDFKLRLSDIDKLQSLREQELALRNRQLAIEENQLSEPEELCNEFYDERVLYSKLN